MWITFLAPAAAGVGVPHAQAQEPTPDTRSQAVEIVDRVDRLLRGESSRGRIRMEIVTSHWSRTLELEIQSLGTDYALIRILSPRKDAGTATLKAGDEIWNYLPRVDRTIKLPTSLMGSAWMGSHFTNDDIVKEHRLIDDYDISISYEGPRDRVRIWEFTLDPKPDAAVIWSRVLYEVRKRDLMPIQARFFDDRGNLVRTITWSDYERTGDRLVPMSMVIVPADKPGESTTIQYEELEFNIGLRPEDFSLRALRSAGR